MQTPKKFTIKNGIRTKVYSSTPSPSVLKIRKKAEVENDDNIFKTIYDEKLKGN